MENDGPATKRARRLSYPDSDETNMDTDSGVMTDDTSTLGWWSQSSHMVGKHANKPLVLRVPRVYDRVPQKMQKSELSSSALVSDKRKRKSSVPKGQFEALEGMSLDAICVWADVMPEFKATAEKFFAVKYRHLELSTLIDPKTGNYTLDKVGRMLRLFGHLVWSLALDVKKLDARDSCADLLAMVRNRCSETLGWMIL